MAKKKNIEWLSLGEIEYRAKIYGEWGALEVSYEHWDQLYRAKADELLDAYEGTDEEITGKRYCGLCIRHVCDFCPFNTWCGDSLWSWANSAIMKWECERSRNSWLEWKKASKAVRDKLSELLEVIL